MDSSIVRLYLPYKEMLDEDMNRVISVSDLELVKDKPESPLTNFLADLLLKEGARVAEEQQIEVRPDLSFLNYGGIRSSLPKGEITVGNIFELMPFENEMVFVKMEGEQIYAFLNYIATGRGGSVGGVKMVIDNDKATNVEVNGKKLDVDKSYWMVTNDYVAGGGDGLDVFQEKLQYINSGVKIRDVIIKHLEEMQKIGQHISTKTDGRIKYE
ncbi:MAG TPA: 5'-nucleotidase [Draconibacterium sp.]|nr:5'-nucleotidase [Draconibacterium sp.]